MKLKASLLPILLTFAAQLCLAQTDTTTVAKAFKLRPPVPTKPLIVLQSGERTMELDPQKDEFFNFDTVAAKSIKSITVLKDEDARNRYGSRGANGVLIVQLDENYVLPRAPMKAFKIE